MVEVGVCKHKEVVEICICTVVVRVMEEEEICRHREEEVMAMEEVVTCKHSEGEVMVIVE